jgi:hypothetical protein
LPGKKWRFLLVASHFSLLIETISEIFFEITAFFLNPLASTPRRGRKGRARCGVFWLMGDSPEDLQWAFFMR